MREGAVLILGGGVMQLPALEAARRLGLQVHLADGNCGCPGVPHSDMFHHVDLADIPGLIAAAGTIENLRGVFTAGTDFSYSVACVARACRLPGIPPDAALRASSKGIMRDALQAAGVAVPRYVRVAPGAVETIIRSRDLPEGLSFPVVVKPVDNMGARGVVLCSSPAELPAAVTGAAELSRQGEVILEEPIPGREYSLDALVCRGEVMITGIAERHIFFPPYFIEMGHTIPGELTPEGRSALVETFQAAIRAIGITEGAAKGDIFLDDRPGAPRAWAGEVAARLSGGYMSGWTYPLATGVPLTELALRVALGEDIRHDVPMERRDTVVAERALLSAPGVVAAVEVPESYPHGVPHVFIRCAPGDAVEPPVNNVGKVANAIGRGASRAEADHRAMEALHTVLVRLEPCRRETDRYLFGPQEGADFSWYAPSGGGSLESAPWIHGTHRQILESLRGGGPLAVRYRPEGPQGISRFPVPPCRRVVEQLEGDGVISMVPTGAAVDRAFWQALYRAGRQGVVYLVDSLKAACASRRALPWESGGPA